MIIKKISSLIKKKKLKIITRWPFTYFINYKYNFSSTIRCRKFWL